MHICRIAGELFPPISGGVGHYVYNLSKKLVEKGHEVTVITRGQWKKTYYEEIDGIFVYRVQFIPTYPFHIQAHGIFVNKLLKSIESNFDIVHLHSPLIPVIHTSLPSVVTEHGTSRSYINSLKLLDSYSLVLKTFSKMYFAIDRKVVNSADKVTAVSNDCANDLRAYYGIKDVEIVYKGVDSNFFIPNENKNEENSYILYTGRLSSGKGLSDLIKSAKYVCKDHPAIRFILAGEGPAKKSFKKLVHDFKLDKNVFFVGHLDQNTLLKYYQNATVSVLPSYYEGLPGSLLEAMSCGIPTIATAVGGMPEVVVEGETGFLIPPNNPAKLASAISKLLKDEKLRKQMGKNARKRVKRYYDWDIITNNIEKIYKSL
jgi:glycosyltransferase involved in cell wall biosynthesis